MFRGNHEHRIDAKGRVSLPAQFREVLKENEGQSPSLVLTNFITEGARCLDGFTPNSWAEFELLLRSRSRFDPQLRKLETYYISRAAECSVDHSGRILIPSYLRRYAGLEREIVFTPALHGFRVWDVRVWELVFSQAEGALMDDPALFHGVDRGGESA